MKTKAFNNIQCHRYLQKLDPLYKHQLTILETLERVVYCRTNKSAIVQLPRQIGKNEINGELLIRFLVFAASHRKTFVSTGLTAKQKNITRQRIEYFARCDPFLPFNQRNIRWENGLYLSNGEAKIKVISTHDAGSPVGQTSDVGETAYAIWVDEAHIANKTVLDSTVIPMGATTGAPVIYSGIWSTGDNDALHAEKCRLLGREPDKDELIFDTEKAIFSTPGTFWCDFFGQHHPWTESYEHERDRLGEDNPHFQINWAGNNVAAISRFFKKKQVESILDSDFERKSRKEHGAFNGYYIVAIDNAGGDLLDEEEAQKQESDRDYACMLIIEVHRHRRRNGFPLCHIVDIVLWRNVDPRTQIERYQEKFTAYNPYGGISDGRGNGEHISRILQGKFLPLVIHKANQKTNDEGCRELEAMVSNGQLKLFSDDGSEEWKEFARQLAHTSKAVKNTQTEVLVKLAKPKGKGKKIDCMAALTMFVNWLIEKKWITESDGVRIG